MQIDGQWECWTLCAAKNKSTYRGEEAAPTCDHGLSRRRPLRVNKTFYVLRAELETKSDDEKRYYWSLSCDQGQARLFGDKVNLRTHNNTNYGSSK